MSNYNRDEGLPPQHTAGKSPPFQTITEQRFLFSGGGRSGHPGHEEYDLSITDQAVEWRRANCTKTTIIEGLNQKYGTEEVSRVRDRIDEAVERYDKKK